ncbi:MAG: Nitrilotriacetate monooxygenase component [Bacteroidetes bacterium]|nr:Nitrilotriacetate monooxygenase component [Bacteroidota bacterium]
MIIDPRNHDPRSIYKLMIGSIVPRPIAFVSSISADGIRNLAPFSFFAGVSADPPVICFCPMVRSSDGKKKDTLQNIESTREFVVNVVSEELVGQMNLCSGEYPPDVDEFELSRLTPVESDLVRPPRVGEARVSMECKLRQIISVSEKPLGASIVLGEILRFHVQDALFDNFKIDPDQLRAVGRMGGPTYIRTRDRFNLERPK